MKAFKYLLASFLVFVSFIITSNSFAAGTSPATDTQSQGTLIASVNIGNPKIISQDKNVFTLSFDITNGKGMQSGVKYGVELVPLDGKYIADQKVYDESLALAENSSISKQITYSAPSQLSGDYKLVLLSNNESGLPLGIASLGKVTLVATSKDLQIVTSSCYLTVDGEKTKTHYTPLQNVDIAQDENLHLTCNTINNSNTAANLVPVYETHIRTLFGKVMPQSGGDLTPINFNTTKNGNFSVLLPKGSAPQFYAMNVSLSDGTNTSNTVLVDYIIRGVSGSIANATLDKDYYRTGDAGTLSLLWSLSIGNFARRTVTETKLPAITLSAHITNASGADCIDPISQPISKSTANPLTPVALSFKSDCQDPHVAVAISDDQGRILDQKDFSYKSGPHQASEPLNQSHTMLIIVILLAIVILIIVMNRRKRTSVIINQ